LVAVIAFAVQQPAFCPLLLSSGDAGSSVGGLVVRESDELPREQPAFVPVQIKRATLDRFNPDRAGIE